MTQILFHKNQKRKRRDDQIYSVEGKTIWNVMNLMIKNMMYERRRKADCIIFRV